MGGGSFNISSYANYSASHGKSYSAATGRVSGQEFVASKIDKDLDPKNFKMRECVDSEEHPETIPVILALDVTGSMGKACQETAEALGVIMTELYGKVKDIEFCVMGIGDLAYDQAPIQMSQFESDVRIAEALDKIYMEHGGGGNSFESYTAAWYMGLHHTKLDCFDKRGKKGIIITMGDETLNPYLPANPLSDCTGDGLQGNVETDALYEEASKKFDIYHIQIEHGGSLGGISLFNDKIAKSFKQVLGERFKVSSVNKLSDKIIECIFDAQSGDAQVETPATSNVNENGEIAW